MADQKRWFKLWHSALDDDALVSLGPAAFGRWCMLGAYTKVDGKKGRVESSMGNRVLAAAFSVTQDELISTIKALPHITVEGVSNRNGVFTVTWANWTQYQEDSTATKRQQLSRSKRRGEREEKRREEKRREIKRACPTREI